MSALSFATEQSNSEDVSIVHARMSRLSLVTERVSPVTHFVVLGTRSTTLCSEKPLDKFGRSPSAETHGHVVFAMEAREGPNTHLMAVNIFTSSNSAVGS